jgi:hypothetical protein
MKELGIVPEAFEETATLFETERRRHSTLAKSARSNANLLPVRPVASAPQPIRSPPVNGHIQSYGYHPAVSAASYGTTPSTRTPRYLLHSHAYTPVYSDAPHSSGEDSSSLIAKWFLGVLVVGSIVWWKYSR